ncbi:DUF4389 domain-containing protein [Alkalimarinus alittae]|uniref:DUF4389 domain-containing protein n=1 Tax=Alkalimarinus alittae TaxID=2961619 RepID=A0ABY6MXC2_9ALTE|nr:DUF4389 domain-containing protein [Alkalimarinus alittae]UZE94455.1 DUF4389 domain-containing protein [Alkalimarinus alittae]
MSDNSEYDKEGHWLRILYMVMFYIVYKISDLVVIVMAILQAVVTTFGNGPNERLTAFGASLATYVSQIVRFLSYADEKKPYPFSEWPKGK